MSPDTHAFSQHPKLSESWICFLLIGCLSMLYAELFSGASRLWFVDLWSLLVTFPLYMVHVLFFFNLALRTHRTSPVHLYLWGILFGLYESWLTQVLWLGYSGQDPLVGTILGIGIGEFLGLVFFWHPVFSFILPLLVFELLVLSHSSDTTRHGILPSHIPLLVKTRSTKRCIGVLYVVGSVFIAFNYQGHILLVIGALSGTYGIIYLLFRKARTCSQFSVYSLKVKRLGMTLIIAYLGALYLFMFFGYGYSGGRIPGLLPVVTTLILYGIFFWLVISSEPSEESVRVPSVLFAHVFNTSDYRKLAVFNVILAAGFCGMYHVLNAVLAAVFLFFYGLICVAGIYLFCKAFLSRNKQTQPSLSHSYDILTQKVAEE